jgi:S-(hydroxymethyl)glutathione dehydrogenase/alcohol dehydrogenase
VKAAVCREFKRALTIEKIELAAPARREVTVTLRACAICHSDIIYMDGGWGGDLPAVYGHEAAGVIEHVGEDVEDFVPGDHVVVTLIRSCGTCMPCSRGNQVMCDSIFHLDENQPIKSEQGEILHQGMRTGAFAEQVLVHQSQIAKIPDSIPFTSAALLACGVLTGYGAVTNTAEVPFGSSVVIIGTGGVGLNTVQGAKAVGADPVIALDLNDDKLSTALAFGATHGINVNSKTVKQQIFDLTSGRGADFVFVTVGAKIAADQGVNYLAKGGKMVIVGMPGSGVMGAFEIVSLAAQSQQIIGSKMGSARVKNDIPVLVSLYQQGRLKLDELVTDCYPLEKINDAIDAVRCGKVIRNVIVFD